MDPNEDGYTSVNGTGYSPGVEDNEIDWIPIPPLSLEPNGDTGTGGGCGATDVVDNPNGGGQSSFVYFDNSRPGVEYLVYRIRLAKNPTGAFGYSILVDTDGKIGALDPNSIVKNPGFEFEVRVSLANSDGGDVLIENIDGTATGTIVISYSQADNFQKVDARFQDCAANVQFFDFFIDIADMGLSSSSTVRLAAATSSQPNNGILSNVSDIAGIDDTLIGTLGDSLATQDEVFIALVNLQSPTPISALGEDGCFKTGTSNTPVVFEPIFDSNQKINGYVNEPEGSLVTVFSNGDTLATSLVSSTGLWSVTFSQGELRSYDEITAIVADSCELNSTASTKINVINDLDSDDDGILDATDEGNGVDPGGDVDGDGMPNYTDPDYPGFIDTSPADGINDSFDPDGDGLSNHLDPDSNGDGNFDYIAAGGDPSDDANNNGTIDSMEDDDRDGTPNTVDADDPSNDGCIDLVATTGGYPDGICDIYQPSTMGGGGSASDTDEDGIADEHDPDADGDGLAAEVDTDEGGTELEIEDVDNDGLPNHLDGDSDGDGIPDSEESTTNDQDGDGLKDFLDTDADGDGLGDFIEAQNSSTPVALSGFDDDDDGLDNSFDPDHGGMSLSSPEDTDSDGIKDYLDSDSDNDGISDLTEGNDFNQNGSADTSPIGLDTDNDGLDDAFDPDLAGTTPGRQDTDGDGVSDYRDTDDDGDGMATNIDGSDFNQGGNPVPDYLFNPDSDGDGVIDSLDPDSDNDGIQDEDEDGGTGFDPVGDEDLDGIINHLDPDDANFAFETDTNGDGIIDRYDFDMDGIPDFKDLDADNDGITDIIEAGGVDSDEDGHSDGGDTDGDGLPDVFDTDHGGTPLILSDSDSDGKYNAYDTDADNDGIVDIVEAQASSGYIPPLGSDLDKDGIDDAYDIHASGTCLTPVNTDADGTPDYLDPDADGDGVSDFIEGHDANKNGIGDWDTNGNGAIGGSEGTGDSDSDGLLDAFDSDNLNFNAAASNSALQDSDGDGTKDFQDTDDDGDGSTTATEGTDFTQGGGSIPDYLYNPDSDGDGINDDLDLDSDNDGIPDADENGGVIDTQNPGLGESLAPTGDRDNDGILNYLDFADNSFTATDANGDGIVDEFDSDLDGIPDFKDLDVDNDGLLDLIETGGTDIDNDGRVDNITDTDGDGLADVFDSDNGGALLDHPDTDNDGTGNAFDRDSDNDGIPDILENGGTDANGDGRVDDQSDVNGNGIADLFETDPLSMPDHDGDLIPNHLDLDTDGDGVTDVVEAGGTDSDSNGIPDVFSDTDRDGFNDLVDSDAGGTALALPDTDTDAHPNYRDIDSDADGIPDNKEAQSIAGFRAPSGTDTDADGIDNSYDINHTGTITLVNTDGKDLPDYLDTDSDNDRVFDSTEGNDTDHNGTSDATPTGTDSDGDGLDDAFEGGVALQDLDADGSPDWRDPDDDGDGITTIDEPLDLNPGNGTKDYLEDHVGSCGLQNITTDFSGNADIVEANSGVTSPGNSLSTSNGTDAVFDNVGDYMILDLTDIIPQSQAITITYRSSKDKAATVRISTSSSPSAGFANFVDLTDNDVTYNNTAYNVNATGGIRYLRFEMTGSSGSASFLLDAVSYQFTQCDSDWDNDAVADIDDNDDDNDGIPDDAEIASTFLADEDSDGLLNFADADYSAFTDANGDGMDDLADFDADGIPNHRDLDSDNDGIPDATEANSGGLPSDMLDDGRFSVAYVIANDFNRDGLVNSYDPDDAGTPLSLPNTDGTNESDFLDIDADEDGLADYIEGFDDDESRDALNDYLIRAEAFETGAGNPGYYTIIDSDSNGIPNWLEIGANGAPQFLDVTYGSHHDTDNDGIVDLFDYSTLGAPYTAPDANDDGLPDYMDLSKEVTLPVELLSFKGTVTPSGVMLEWKTASESQNDFFDLYKSHDGLTYTTIATIAGAGDTKEEQSYLFNDQLSIPGFYYYKLAQTDFDGTYEDLQIILVEFESGDVQIEVYPNPAVDQIRIAGSLLLPDLTLIIKDLTGRVLLSYQHTVTEETPEIDIRSLGSGIYLLEIRSPELNKSLRFIKK